MGSESTLSWSYLCYNYNFIIIDYILVNPININQIMNIVTVIQTSKAQNP